MKSIPPVFLRLVSVVLVLLMVALPVHADSGSSTPTPAWVSTRLVKDSAQIAEIADTLRKSDALMATFENVPSEEITTQWLETFASVMTRDQAQRFVEVDAGKHFEVIGAQDDGQPSVALVDGAPRSESGAESCCRCWQARVAFWAWWAGTNLLCVGAAGAAGVVSGPGGVVTGVVCSGVFHEIGNLPDFDNACA